MGKQPKKMKTNRAMSAETQERRRKCEQGLRRKAEPKFWDKWGEPILTGFILFLFCSLMYSSWFGGGKKLSAIDVNDEVRIEFINNMDLGFSLDANPFFEGRNLQNAQDMANNLLSQDKKVGKCNLEGGEALKEEYNFYKRYPSCRFDKTLTFGESLGYAEVASAVYEERECAGSQGTSSFVPSVSYITRCDKKNLGKKGGAVKELLHFMKETGTIDGTCMDQLELGGDACPKSTEVNECARKKIKEYCMLDKREMIQQEIMTNGPVISVIPGSLNFLTYKRGVLRLDENSKKVGGNFVVKLVGWQKKKDIMVWVVDPMFGTGYGDNGLVYVSMENEEEFGEVALSMRLFEEAVSEGEMESEVAGETDQAEKGSD